MCNLVDVSAFSALLAWLFDGSFSTNGLYRGVTAREINPIMYLLEAEPGFEPRSFCCQSKYCNDSATVVDSFGALLIL